MELDESAAIISYEEYYPFGSSSYRSGRNNAETSLKRYRYVGKERDDETGLYYYGARYYAAWLARFVSVDPLKDEFPFYASYQYAGNKPIVATDLQGKQEDPKVEGYSLPQVPTKLPTTLTEFLILERPDFISRINTGTDNRNLLKEIDGPVTKSLATERPDILERVSFQKDNSELLSEIKGSLQDFILDKAFIIKKGGEFKFDNQRQLNEIKTLQGQDISNEEISKIVEQRQRLANRVLGNESLDSLIFGSQGANKEKRSANKLAFLKRERAELLKLKALQDQGFDFGALGNILDIIGGVAEITGLVLIATGVGGPIGAGLYYGGKGLSVIGTGLQLYEDLEKGNSEAAGLRLFIFVGGEVSGGILGSAAEKKLINDGVRILGEVDVKIHSKIHEQLIIEN